MQPNQPHEWESYLADKQIGATMRGVVATTIAEQTNMTVETREMLSGCLDQFERAVESLCPVAMVPTRNGVHRLYGPGGIKPGERVVTVATPKRFFTYGLDEWFRNPQAEAYLRDNGEMASGELWGMLVRAMEDQAGIDTNMVVKLVNLRCATENGCERIDAELKKVWQLNMTPLITVLAAASVERLTVLPAASIEWRRSCGLVWISLLPPTLEIQIEAVEAQDAARGRGRSAR